MKSLTPSLSRALALLATRHTLNATAERMDWPGSAVRRLADAQAGWLVVDGRVTCPGEPGGAIRVPDGVRREHLEWARQLLQDAPATGPARAVLPPTRRPGAEATRPQEPAEALAPRPVAELVSVPEPPPAEREVPAVLAGLIAAEHSCEPGDVTVSVAEIVPSAPAASATVRKRSEPSGNVRRPRASGNVRRRSEPSGDVRKEPVPSEDVRGPVPSGNVRCRSESAGDVREGPVPSEETVPERPAEPAVDEVADETPATEEPKKRCPRCDKAKAHSEFYLSTQTADGLSPWCRPCFRAARS
ncbi:hypothetical protein ACFYOK_37545 [Microbispora bryophytorum]|uniref:hypothetical protein n=1 Tax=Microbispora bryophytorum TaxID=1460882 RepID=UPI00340CABE5